MVRCSRICCILSIRCGSEVRWMGMRIQKSERLLSSKHFKTIDCWFHWLMVRKWVVTVVTNFKRVGTWVANAGQIGKSPRNINQNQLNMRIKTQQKNKHGMKTIYPYGEFPTIWNWSPTHCHHHPCLDMFHCHVKQQLLLLKRGEQFPAQFPVGLFSEFVWRSWTYCSGMSWYSKSISLSTCYHVPYNKI